MQNRYYTHWTIDISCVSKEIFIDHIAVRTFRATCMVTWRFVIVWNETSSEFCTLLVFPRPSLPVTGEYPKKSRVWVSDKEKKPLRTKKDVFSALKWSRHFPCSTFTIVKTIQETSYYTNDSKSKKDYLFVSFSFPLGNNSVGNSLFGWKLRNYANQNHPPPLRMYFLHVLTFGYLKAGMV